MLRRIRPGKILLKIFWVSAAVLRTVTGGLKRSGRRGPHAVDYLSLLLGGFIGAWVTNVTGREANEWYIVLLAFILAGVAILITRSCPPGGPYGLPRLTGYLPFIKLVFVLFGSIIALIADPVFNKSACFGLSDMFVFVILLAPLTVVEA